MPIDCWECSALGDDYYMDEDGDWVSACDGCPNNPLKQHSGHEEEEN